MNEVLAIVYICFQGLEHSQYIEPQYQESDIFFAFSNLMTDIRDCFLRELDKEPTGIEGHVQSYTSILRVIDPKCL